MTVSLAELFSRDPREMTDEDFRQVVIGLRAARANFLTEGTRAIQSPKAQSAIARLDLDIKL